MSVLDDLKEMRQAAVKQRDEHFELANQYSRFATEEHQQVEDLDKAIAALSSPEGVQEPGETSEPSLCNQPEPDAADGDTVEPIAVNMPFERLPQHASDPGTGDPGDYWPPPPRPKVEPLFQTPFYEQTPLPEEVTGERGEKLCDEPSEPGDVCHICKAVYPNEHENICSAAWGDPIPEGFTKWEGGECPVWAGSYVEFVTRATTAGCFEVDKASSLRWEHAGAYARNDEAADDIIAYRVIPQSGADNEAQGEGSDDRTDLQTSNSPKQLCEAE